MASCKPETKYIQDCTASRNLITQKEIRFWFWNIVLSWLFLHFLVTCQVYIFVLIVFLATSYWNTSGSSSFLYHLLILLLINFYSGGSWKATRRETGSLRLRQNRDRYPGENCLRTIEDFQSNSQLWSLWERGVLSQIKIRLV